MRDRARLPPPVWIVSPEGDCTPRDDAAGPPSAPPDLWATDGATPPPPVTPHYTCEVPPFLVLGGGLAGLRSRLLQLRPPHRDGSTKEQAAPPLAALPPTPRRRRRPAAWGWTTSAPSSWPPPGWPTWTPPAAPGLRGRGLTGPQPTCMAGGGQTWRCGDRCHQPPSV